MEQLTWRDPHANECVTTPIESDFAVKEAFSRMQHGLVGTFSYCDVIYVTHDQVPKKWRGGRNLRRKLKELLIAEYAPCEYRPNYEITDEPELDQVLVSAFSSEFWNEHMAEHTLSKAKVGDSHPECEVWRTLPQEKKDFYKFSTAILFQIKKKEPNSTNCHGHVEKNSLTVKVQGLLKEEKLDFNVIYDSDSRNFCGSYNAVMAGRFQDGIEKTKDPYSLFLNCLIGYDRATHLGGSYLLFQRCEFKWNAIHSSNENMAGIVGRNQITDDSTIFSQMHCPHSHIRTSRVKDDDGNPVVLYRDSRTYTTDGFSEENERTIMDNINPEEGIVFLGYHKSPHILERMMAHQLGHNKGNFTDSMLNMFYNSAGNVLYVPTLLELTDKVTTTTSKEEPHMTHLFQYHQVRWLKIYKKAEDDEMEYKKTNNPYHCYSRPGYMVRMSCNQHNVDPPSPRILRLVSKTFALWHDTWYFDRKQRPLPALWDVLDEDHGDYLDEDLIAKKKHQANPPFGKDKSLVYGCDNQSQLSLIGRYIHLRSPKQQETLKQNKETRNKLRKLVKERKTLTQEQSKKLDELEREQTTSVYYKYEDIPFRIRNGMSVYYTLGHVLTSPAYGCRGPTKEDPNYFGGNTFHLEPEDLLAGGEANLTLGQGKHLMDYMTEAEKQKNYQTGTSLAEHSGVGHVTPYINDFMEHGVDAMVDKFKQKAVFYAQQFKKNDGKMADNVQPKDDLKTQAQTTYINYLAAKGIKHYFENYAAEAHRRAEQFKNEKASYESLRKLGGALHNLSKHKPATFQEAAQLCLSAFICLHITGEPVSIGRLDHVMKHKANAWNAEWNQQHQDIIDCFWLKVGEKANFNRGTFEDHQMWGNLAIGGLAGPYPQSASFNQWGHQLTVGGLDSEGKPFYNSITFNCLRAARTIPVNAPCLGLRLNKDVPDLIKEEAAKAMLAGGAHPIILNDEKCFSGFKQAGDYQISKDSWALGKEQYPKQELWGTEVLDADARDFTSDGCFELLVTGKSWFMLGGCCVLQPLEYVINVGKSLLQSGSRFIHGSRDIYRYRDLSTYDTYDKFQQQYFDTFEDVIVAAFTGQLSNYGRISHYCPAPLLNVFTAHSHDKHGDKYLHAQDFYENGVKYKLFCPMYTGVANLANSLWNIRELVYRRKITSLEEVRMVLCVDWGNQFEEPFIPNTLPITMRNRYKQRCDTLRKLVWQQPKFGVDQQVTKFGLRISHQLSRITRKVFESPKEGLLNVFHNLTQKYGTKDWKMGFQYMPGCGTFENYADVGAGLGASFDGRLKGQTIAQDYSPQNYFMDIEVGDRRYPDPPVDAQHVINNYGYSLDSEKDPKFYSGAVLDLNLAENYPLDRLKENLHSFACGQGPNIITVTVADREKLQDALHMPDRDLQRVRMGGWTEFTVAIFPHLLNQHVRRVREIYVNDDGRQGKQGYKKIKQ